MITWMQKHKKYLVITIWISTIAFVGAGFVGWGHYDLNNKRATSVAQVGSRTISVAKFNKAYGEAFNYYSQTSGGKFTQEQADKIGLDAMVMGGLIQEELLLNLADDIGLAVSDAEISRVIAAQESFQENGVFSKKKYADVLRSLRITAKEYETDLKESLLLQKLLSAITLKPSPLDEQILESGLFMKDRLRAMLVVVNSDEIQPSDSELKSLWESSKDKYLTPVKYELSTKFIRTTAPVADESEFIQFYEENRGNYRNADDKILAYDDVKNAVRMDFSLKNAKKIALEEYLKIKKGDKNATDKMQVSVGDVDFPLDQIISAKIGDVIKPFAYKDGYLIVRLDGVEQAKPKDFEAAKDDVRSVFKENEAKKILENRAKEALNNFKGKDVGYVSKDARNPVLKLSPAEFNEFLEQLFSSSSKKGYVLLDKKAVVYEITDQKMSNGIKKAEFGELVARNAAVIKNEELRADLIKTLQKRYKIKQYYKGSALVD